METVLESIAKANRGSAPIAIGGRPRGGGGMLAGSGGGGHGGGGHGGAGLYPPSFMDCETVSGAARRRARRCALARGGPRGRRRG